MFNTAKTQLLCRCVCFTQNSAKIVIFAIWHKKEPRFPKSRKSRLFERCFFYNAFFCDVCLILQ
nr:MAG TPA: hypothetical protein [Caudoviricetes sp.]